ncbi:MAG: QueG-associated DUF1730 domain-containing protein, partial [Thermoanaerobaculia bacterium]|nr:QueG-associated DUF1730 domain-containing protein [Thermoanaerobaculia bacterium]
MTEAKERSTSRSTRRRRRRRGKARTEEGPVPLFKRSSSHFQEADRDRGQTYFEEGRVEVSIDGERALVKVAGSDQETYAVGVDWSQVEKRRDARAAFPWARSVLSVGLQYDSDTPYSTDAPPERGWISRYAWGDDYHEVMGRMLR